MGTMMHADGVEQRSFGVAALARSRVYCLRAGQALRALPIRQDKARAAGQGGSLGKVRNTGLTDWQGSRRAQDQKASCGVALVCHGTTMSAPVRLAGGLLVLR
jgi:hypothetical protein